MSLLLTTSLYTNCSMVEALGTKAAKEVDKSANQNPSVLSVGLAVGMVEGRAEGLLDGAGVGLWVRATPSGSGDEVVGTLVVGMPVGLLKGCDDGWLVGCPVGARDGTDVGCPLGCIEG